MGKIKIFSKSSELNYPVTKPTLNLNFAATKNLDPRITYTRNSIGTYVGADGYIKTAVANEPRFDHDPLTGKCLGLLMEEARTNLMINSHILGSVTSFNGTAGTIQTILPDGTTGTARTLSTNIKNNNAFGSITATIAGDYYFSFWVKNVSGFSIILGYGISPGNVNNRFYGAALPDDGKWYRVGGVVPTNLPSSSLSNISFCDSRVFGSTDPSITPISIIVWGGQVEMGIFPTTYIPTLGSAVTRAADSATITGTNFSQWYNSSEGTLLSIDEKPTSYISLPSSLIIFSNSSSTRTISNLLYYPKKIEYATLKTMNAYTSAVVTDGLILNLDAGNPQSYPGNGTTWTDLSRSANTGTLGASPSTPSFSTSNGGSLVFDGVDDYVRCSISDVFNNFSYDIWCLPLLSHEIEVESTNATGGTTGQKYVIGPQFVNSPDAGSGISVGTNGVSVYEHSAGYMPPLLVYSTTINAPIHIVVNYTNKTPSLYLNGGFIKNGLTSTKTNVKITTDLIGSYANYGYFSGRIYSTKFYNRALSAVEVQQNFNALRGRFGI